MCAIPLRSSSCSGRPGRCHERLHGGHQLLRLRDSALIWSSCAGVGARCTRPAARRAAAFAAARAPDDPPAAGRRRRGPRLGGRRPEVRVEVVDLLQQGVGRGRHVLGHLRSAWLFPRVHLRHERRAQRRDRPLRLHGGPQLRHDLVQGVAARLAVAALNVMRGSSCTAAVRVASFSPTLTLTVNVRDRPRGRPASCEEAATAPAAARCPLGSGGIGDSARVSHVTRLTPALAGPVNSRTVFPASSAIVIFALLAPGRLVLQVVGDDQAVRRVLPEERLVAGVAGVGHGETASPGASGRRARRGEHLRVDLLERCQVVQDPDRPPVGARIRSLSRGWIRMSSTGTVGRFIFSRCHARRG